MGIWKLPKKEAVLVCADVVVIGGAGDVYLAVGFGQFVLALGRGHALLRGAKIRAILQSLGLQILEFHLHRDVIEIAGNVEILGNGFVPQKLPQADQRLHFGELRLGHVLLKLQHLQLDLQKIAFADVAGVVAGLADIHRVLKALHVLQREIERGFGKLHAHELRGNVEGERALVVGDQ